MEQREMNVIIGKAGGTAGKTAINAKISIPTAWAREMGITAEDRSVTMKFDGEKIIIEKIKKLSENA